MDVAKREDYLLSEVGAPTQTGLIRVSVFLSRRG